MTDAGKYILIVDDSVKNLQLTASLLKDNGYLISLAQDAEAAMIQLNDLIPDLILLDVMMPGTDGFELCRRIKKKEKLCDIPVIFLTAKTETSDLAEGFKAGGVDYITKPFNRDELLLRVKNHIELASSRKRIVEMNMMRDKLYSVIAHDIRSPLSSISLTLSAIASGYLDPASEDFKLILKDLEKTANETNILLDNLLEFTRHQQQNASITPKYSPLYPVIMESVQLLKGNAEKKSITVKSDIASDIVAYFDEVTMYTVFRNIIFNAIKFTPVNGSVRLDSHLENEYAVVRISDTGIGISDDILKKIFVKNEHYTSRGTNMEQGSGLGLYIIKDFVNKNHGKLEIKSTPGEGTDILVYLPLKPL
jgi:two-component system sensor histidine kinase/response regulator